MQEGEDVPLPGRKETATEWLARARFEAGELTGAPSTGDLRRRALQEPRVGPIGVVCALVYVGDVLATSVTSALVEIATAIQERPSVASALVDIATAIREKDALVDIATAIREKA